MSYGESAGPVSSPAPICWGLTVALAVAGSVRGADDPAADLQPICQEIRQSFDPFYGRARADEVRRQLAAGSADSQQEATLRGVLGRELLKLGEIAESIALLERALELARQSGMPENAITDLEVHFGLAHLQAGEDQNCVLAHSGASCILPFRPEAVHRQREHARRAGDLFLGIVRRHPGAVQSVWLLNLARMASGDYPAGVPEPLRLPDGALESTVAFPTWIDRAPELGTAAVDLAGGAVMDDFDGDGRLDLVTSTWDPCDSLKAYRNDGRGGFEEVTQRWGLDRQLGGLNLAHADYDNDGHLDLLVLRGAWMGERGRIRNSLLHNELHLGRGFADVTRTAGIAQPAYPTQTAAFADFDGDGDLDLYVGNEDPDGKSYPSQLLRNEGDGSFTDVAVEAGVDNHRFAKAVTWGDFDDDGDPDLYVSNIGPNRLYRNDGARPDGTPVFVDVAPALGVTEPEGRSFASWFFDWDNDGDLDLFVADYESPVPAVAAYYFGLRAVPNRPRLYRNDGASFTDVAEAVGLARPMLPMGANYGDLDSDGYPDIYLGTGEPGYETIMPNVMFHNDRGRSFVDVTFAGGFGHLQKGHGVAFGDVDGDGDQDLLHQLGGFFPGDAFANALFENPTLGAHWITLRLEGTRANRFGVGGRIAVRLREGDTVRTVHALVGSGGSFGGSSLQQEIGLGHAEAILDLTIVWPGSGTAQRFADVALDRFYQLVEGKDLEALDVLPVPLRPAGTGHDTRHAQAKR